MKTNKIYLYFFITLLLSSVCFSLFAQGDDPEDPCLQVMGKTISKEYKKARDFQKEGKKEEALAIYEKLIEQDPTLLEVNYYYAMMYYQPISSNNFKITNRNNANKAMSAFNRIYDVCPFFRATYCLYAARLAYMMEEFDEATKFATVLIENPDIVKNMDNLDEAQVIIDRSHFYGTILKNPVPFDPVKVPGISTDADEYLATISPDGSEFYFTRRKSVNIGSYFGGDKEDREFFSMSSKNTSGQFGIGSPLPYPFNEGNSNEGSPTISITNDMLIFAKRSVAGRANVDGSDGTYPNYDLYMSQLIDGEWTTPKSINSNINRPNSWESQPSLSSDGKILFFASDRAGGYGGSDIWFSERNNDGTWRNPVNAGPAINTSGNERSPFLHTDSKTLYFSSSGHQGLGGLDIFYSKYDDKKGWQKAVNIGYPINSEKDEVDFFVSLDGENAYFSSNNVDSKDWNIYTFPLYEAARPRNMIIIKGNVQSDDGDLVGAVVEIRDTALKILATAPVNEISGNYAVATEIDKEKPQDLIVNVKKENHSFDTKLVSIENQKELVITKNAEVKKVELNKTYDLHDIYFATNSFQLNAQSLFIINMFIQFLEENPAIKVEIQGHTDDIGDDKANQILSENRAKSVYNYIVSKSLNPNRLRFKGYGESAPIVPNTTPENRAKNRRTVFLIYGD